MIPQQRIAHLLNTIESSRFTHTLFTVFISVLGLPLCLALPICFFDLFNFLWLGTGTTSRLKQLGMEFTVWVFKHVSNF